MAAKDRSRPDDRHSSQPHSGKRDSSKQDSTGSVLRDAAGTWLTGPYQAPGEVEYRGADLGLPETGPGSIAGGWRRVMGLLVDWIVAGVLAFVFVGPRGAYEQNGHVYSAFEMTVRAISLPQFITWFVVGVLAVAVFGYTPGQFAVGTRVARVDFGAQRGAAEAAGTEPRAAVGIVRALFRQLLIPFLVPALINDYNGRAMHDRATGTAIVCTR